MRISSKITLIIGIVLVLFLIIVNIQFKEKINLKLEENVLVYYSQGLGIAGRANIEILNDGSIGKVKTYVNKPWKFEEFDRLSSEELNQLKNAINNNQFTLSKTSLFEMWRINNPGCFDCDMSAWLYINKNSETIKVGRSKIIWDIVLGIKLL